MVSQKYKSKLKTKNRSIHKSVRICLVRRRKMKKTKAYLHRDKYYQKAIILRAGIIKIHKKLCGYFLVAVWSMCWDSMIGILAIFVADHYYYRCCLNFYPGLLGVVIVVSWSVMICSHTVYKQLRASTPISKVSDKALFLTTSWVLKNDI